MLEGYMLHPLLQQMFKMASLYMNTSRESSSLFISHLINNRLLYVRDHTQTLLQVFFKSFSHSFKSFDLVCFYPFVANSFTNLLALNLKLVDNFFQNMIFFIQIHFVD